LYIASIALALVGAFQSRYLKIKLLECKSDVLQSGFTLEALRHAQQSARPQALRAPRVTVQHFQALQQMQT
jgi:hypothetical protein